MYEYKKFKYTNLIHIHIENLFENDIENDIAQKSQL